VRRRSFADEAYKPSNAMKTILIIAGTLLLFNVLYGGNELLHAVESARWGLADSVASGGLIPLVDRAGHTLLGLLTAPPVWKLLLGGFLLHRAFRSPA
jgi:hypothetical protein